MKFAFLLYGSDADWETLAPDEQRRVRERYGAIASEARAAGTLVDGAELRPTATATTVRVRDGETVVTHGPFAETVEQLAGFFALDCRDLEEALVLARRLPAAEHGAVEVRAAHVDEEEATP